VAELLREAAGLNVVERRTDFEGGGGPVLLLYGFSSTRRALDVLERRLRRDGYAVFSLNLGGLRRTLDGGGIDDRALLVRDKVERLYARHPGLGPLTIVGHSQGGLVAAWYVKRLGGWRRARAVVTLGTPHHGTPLALLGVALGPFGRSAWQMLPRSAFLARLAAGPWPPRVRLASVWSRRDELALYPSPVIDTHGLPHLANVEVDASHGELLASRRVYEAIRREILEAEASAPVRRGPLEVMAGGGRATLPRCATGAGITSTTGRSSR
jgi:pimeloyl-ACP methyl ester carboxylesterase